MFEKVNPAHPDKIADRIAGAIVDLAYQKEENPRIAVEVLIGHGECNIIAESSVYVDDEDVRAAVYRITRSEPEVRYRCVEQDALLAGAQADGICCGDNGIFRGEPLTAEQTALRSLADFFYGKFGCDGKYLSDCGKLVICQSRASEDEIEIIFPWAKINPLGDWAGGTDVDTGATNRKLGSDMGGAVTGGGLHGKDLSKADVSVNIYAHLKAQEYGKPVEFSCAIGDKIVDGRPYGEIVEIARGYIRGVGGFEKFAEWGLI